MMSRPPLTTKILQHSRRPRGAARTRPSTSRFAEQSSSRSVGQDRGPKHVPDRELAVPQAAVHEGSREGPAGLRQIVVRHRSRAPRLMMMFFFCFSKRTPSLPRSCGSRPRTRLCRRLCGHEVQPLCMRLGRCASEPRPPVRALRSAEEKSRPSSSGSVTGSARGASSGLGALLSGRVE